MECFKFRAKIYKMNLQRGQWFGTVGRAVTSDTRDTWFEFSHWQILVTINCAIKTVLKRRNSECYVNAI